MRLALLLSATTLLLSACTGNADESGSGGAPNATTSPGSQGAGSPGPSEAGTADPGTGSGPTPVSDEPFAKGLVWKVIATGAADEYEDITALPGGRQVALTRTGDLDIVEKGGTSKTLDAGDGRRFGDVFVTGTQVVAVAQDDLEERAAQVHLVDIGTGKTARVELAPSVTSGGSWSGVDGKVAYATFQGRNYCLAVADLRTERGEAVECVEPGNGLSKFTMTSAGVGFQSFDDRRPVSCRTAAVLLAPNAGGGDPDRAQVVSAATKCKSWDTLPVPGAVVWSEIPKERQVERAEWYAGTTEATVSGASDGEVVALGSGVTSSAVWCGQHMWFARDAEDGAPARLMRWSPKSGLEVAREVPADEEGFFTKPRCGGDRLTVSMFGENRFEQLVTLM